MSKWFFKSAFDEMIIGVAVSCSMVWLVTQCHRASAEDTKENTAYYNINVTEEKLSITTAEADSRAFKAPSHNTIEFHLGPDVKVFINADGTVRHTGTLDEATRLFWQKTAEMFPDFKRAICESGK